MPQAKQQIQEPTQQNTQQETQQAIQQQTKDAVTLKGSENQSSIKTPLATVDSPKVALPVDLPNKKEETTSVDHGENDANAAKPVLEKNVPESSDSPLATTKADNVSSAAANDNTPSSNQDLPIVEPAVTTIFPPKNTDVPQFPVITAYERVQNAIAFLNEGNEFQAEKELADALVIEPGNRSARKLIRILNQSNGIYFSQTEYFKYRVRPNETLLDVAKKFLNDPMEFYPLAKLNNIKIPADVAAGQILKIPGERNLAEENVQDADAPKSINVPSEHRLSAEKIKFERAKVYYAEHRYQEAIDLLNQSLGNQKTSEQRAMRQLLAENYRDYSDLLIKKGELSAAQSLLESSVDILPENNDLVAKLLNVKKDKEAERLYQLGMVEIKIGKDDLALKTLSKALKLNPHHSLAKKQIADLKLSVIESYHKKAMVLYRKQELSQAIEVWDEILQLDPNYDLAKQYRAKALELKRRIKNL